MNTLKQLGLLLLLCCCTYFVKAQCSAAFTYTVSGTSVEVRITHTYLNSTYTWKVDGVRASNIATADSVYTLTGLYAGTHIICSYVYVPNGSQVCDSSCQTITVTSCGSLTPNWTSTIGTNDTVRFAAADTNSVAHHGWNFGDNTSASGTSATHVFTQPGTYHVCFYAYVPNSLCVDSSCESVVVPQPNHCAGLSAYYYNSTPVGDSVHFTGYDTLSTATNYFSFGDGTTANGLNANHIYNAPGTYTACFYSYIPGTTCRDSLCRSVTISGTTACGTAAVNYYIVGDTSIHAYSTSTGTDSTSIYNWRVTNSSGTIVQTAGGRNVSYIVTAGLSTGTYTVCEYLYNANQQFCDSACISVTITRCAPGLTAYWTKTISGDTVRFVAADTVSSAHNYWNFGDGTTGSGTSVTHIYTTAGTYHVCLYAYVPGSSCTDSLCESVTVQATTTCGTPSFSYYLYGDTSIHAYSTSINTSSNTTYGWTIKNSNNVVVQSQTGSTSYIVSHSLTPGLYTVCLTLYNGTVRCDSACNTIVIPIVGACGTPGFRDTVYTGIGGGAIHAFNTSTNIDSMQQISWKIWGPNGNLVQTFNGGDFTSSVLDSGNYTVCQYIRATAQTSICDSLCQTVVVGGGTNPCAGLTANWTYVLRSNTTDSVEFHGGNNPAGTYYTWSFGDGTFATGQNVSHGYAQAGTYNVCLITIMGTSNTSSCRDTSCQSITITTTTACPTAAFSMYVYQDSMIHAYSSSTGTTTNTYYEWVVKNAAGTVVQTYTNTGTTSSFMSNALPNGTYNVCLYIYATNTTLCNYVCHTITIADSVRPCSGLNANFTETHLTNGNVQFIPVDTATGITHYWHFGDGTVSTNNDPVHAYSQSGLYHVCQYVFYTGQTNCIDSFCTNVQANASGCSANFSYQGFYPPANGIQFNNLSTSSDSITTYYWGFGDGSTGHTANPDHVYANGGRYYVCLYIATANGCNSSHCDSITVHTNVCAGLTSTFTYTYTQGGGVHFAGSTTISSVTNLWIFGDGTTATTFDPVHYYTQSGVYNVCHIVTIPGTLCADTTCETIQGSGTGNSCHANFTDSAYANNTSTIIFTNTSTSNDSIVSYAWSFGDGSTSSSSNTHHTYANNGSYYVCLTITSRNGCTNTICDSVHVGHTSSTPCHASFTYTVDSCQVITFTSTSTGALEFLRWDYGDGTTDTLSHPTHVYAQGGSYTVILHFYGSGCYNFDTAVISVPSCSSQGGDTICGNVFNDLNGNGVQNTNETGIANAEVHVGNYVTHTDSTGHYVIVVPAGTYSIYYCAPTGYSFTIPVHMPMNSQSNCAIYEGVVVNSGSNCGYNFGIQSNTVTICGTVYYDTNNDHVQEQGESGIPNTEVIFTESGHVVYSTYTDQYGHYCAVLATGSYVITVGTSTYHNSTVTPTSITVNATTAGGSYDNNNFAVYSTNTGSCDLSINVTPNTNVTPGYPAWYQIEVCNVGANITSGTVNLFYDPSLRYNYAQPTASSQNSTTYTATWNLNNLNPGSCQFYYVSLTADSNLTTGQFIFTLASVNTTSCNDANQANNVDTVHQNVTASWDPNNKQVSPAGIGNEGLINGNQELTYTINFQNTGTAPAINIVIQDTLSQYLDVATFKMLGASLPYTMQMNGNIVVWKFNGVSLPDSSTDEQASHGFVSFMITPLQGLPTKTQITNQADIYFDFNAGVSTNRTLNTIDYSLAVSNIEPNNVTITLQPNPFSQYTTIKVDGAEGPYQLNVYDMVGRLVKNQQAAGNVFSVERGNLATGMYMYEVMHNGTVIGKGKMIAQ